MPALVFPLLVATCLVDFISPGRAPENALARWMEDLLWGLPGREADRFVTLPSVSSVEYGDVLGLVNLPLREATRPGRDQRQVGQWQSAPIRLPSGEFVVRSDTTGEVELCNGEGCFASSRLGQAFKTGVGLARFRVHSDAASPNLGLRPERLFGKGVTALQSLALESGLRLHALDENVFFEPRGFWIRAGAKAHFVLEGRRDVEVVLSLANGGRENWVEVEQPKRMLQFSLRPFETKRIQALFENDLAYLTVTSATGFRPAELDPAKNDHRRLGVFLTAPVFDLSREPSR